MPAIYPTRLRKQTSQLAELFGQPAEFTHSLIDLLELYSDRAHRPGQSGEPPPLLKSYNAPKPVIRQLKIDLQPLADEYPDEALALINALWVEPSLETRQIAAFLLGSVPPNRPEALLQLVNTWLNPQLEERLMSIVLQLSLERICREQPDVLLTQIEIWLESHKAYEHQIGLKSLIPIILRPDYENLPQYFRLLAPYTRVAPLQIRSDILNALHALITRSPKEAAYLLRQSLNSPENPDTALLVRKLLPVFPTDLQESLRQALRTAQRES